MRRMGIILASIALGVTGLAACSSGDDQYCSKLEERQDDQALANLDPSDPESMDTAKAVVDEVVDVAPDDVKSEWESLSEAFTTLSDAAADPVGADLAEVQELAGTTTDSMQAIEADAEERCGITLS